MNKRIGIALITHCAKHHLPKALPPLLNATVPCRVVVVNSSSHDGTVELAEEMGAETLVIPRAEFNHGLTREKARKFLGTEIVVMMTPDAYAVDEGVIERLVEPIVKGEASVTYAKQIPHDGAGFFETFHREFNYPAEGQTRSLNDREKYGVYTLFCSDSCAAYLNSALDEIGGFQETLTAEDTFAVAKLLKKGHKISYNTRAVVHHSHSYSLWQEFQRHFDTGLVRKLNADLIQEFGSDSGRGFEYVLELLKKILKEKPYLFPYACLQVLCKYAGYTLGKCSLKFSKKWKRCFSSQDYYW